MSARAAGNYLSEMVESRVPELGRERAVSKVARDAGLTYWSAYRLMKHMVKTISTDQFLKIRLAYLDWCLGEIKRMQLNREAAEDDDLMENLESEVLALRSKVRQAQTEVKHATE
jgi:hypothetical protein